MKLGPVTKLDKRNKTRSKKFDDGAISNNCHCHYFDLRPVRSNPKAGFRTPSL